MPYGEIYYLDFCDALGNPRTLSIYRKDYAGSRSSISGGGSPVVINYKNNDDNKFNPITTSGAVITLRATETLNLNTFYTEDEREWKVTVYDMGDPVRVIWTGYIIPDNANEPFLSLPYDFSLKATDILETLKTVPYMNGNALIKKEISFKDLLGECLERTGLDLHYVIGVNTYFLSSHAISGADPLSKTIVDTTRFIDPNNKAFSCYEILEAICRQFTANLKQVDGKWYFIDISEYVYNTLRVREFTSTGFLTDSFQITNDNELQPEQIVNRDHNIEKEPAYKSVVSYYQYGFLSNKLVNGDFNDYNETTNIFNGWTQIGASTWSTMTFRKNMINLPSGPSFFGNYSLVYQNRKETIVPGSDNWREIDLNKYIYSSPVPITLTTLASFSINVSYNSSVDGFYRVYTGIKLSAPGETDRYWDESSKSWKTEPTVVVTAKRGTELDLSKGGTTVTVNMDYPPYEGFLEVRIYGLASLFPGEYWLAYEGIFDNAALNLSENEYYKSDIGLVNQIDNLGNYSKAPEPIVLLFGDDSNKNRTSWMRDENGVPTTGWIKYSPAGVLSAPHPLQHFTTFNILNQYQKPSRRVEGSFMGVFTPVDTFEIPLIDGKFIFLSGEFDVKSAINRLVLAEVFTEELTTYNETTFKDYGSFKDSSGSTVGSPTGVNIPPVNSTLGFVPEDTANKGQPGGYAPLNEGGTIDPVYLGLASFDDFIKNQTTLQANAKFHVKGGRFNSYLILPKTAPEASDIPNGEWAMWVGDEGVGAPQPPIIANLVDLQDVSIASRADGYVLYWNASTSKFEFKPDGGGGGGSSAWADITGKPTTLSGYGITDAYPSSNPSGYITGINSGMVTTALGYTPVNPSALGSNAYSSTAYLPLMGGTLSGIVNLNNNIFLKGYSLQNNPASLIGINNANQISIDADGYGTVFGGALNGTSATFSGALVASNISGTNTGDETTARINALYGYTPANGANYAALSGATFTGLLTAPKVKANTLLTIPTVAPNVNDMANGEVAIWVEGF